MSGVYFDAKLGDDVRRARLYDGSIFVYRPRDSALNLTEYARGMIKAAFAGLDPELAQHYIPVERFVEICAPLKPAFIHDPATMGLLQRVVAEFGCDLEKTYIDVPRLRMVTSDGYLTSGIGYAHHPHRDTWYSAPASQINWWLPIYGIDSESAMAFHLNYWNKPILNGSGEFNYYEWNKVGRRDAAKHIKSDLRKQPRAEEPLILHPDMRLITPPGGLILFSADQLHSTVPNTTGKTRYSIDFRTVHIDDVGRKTGAALVDSRCSGTSLRDFVRGTDLSAMDADIVALYDDLPAPEEFSVFKPGL